MVVKKTPREILGIGFSIAGGLLIVVAVFLLGLTVTAIATGEEAILGVTLPSLLVSVGMIAVGVIFAGVGFYFQSTPAPKRKR